jgi:leukotriene-A4 hydrolase
LLKLKIEYSTSPTATALQWLDAKLTLGKKHPYLFSQCQAIHARSILPCQDTPSVKFTYDATVRVQKPLQVLMSAIQKDIKDLSDQNLLEYKFKQHIKIPSYLMAIAVGHLTSRFVSHEFFFYIL